MGTGKTSVGSALAAALRWPLSDSDFEIEAATGRTAREIARDDGPDAIHLEEQRHVLRALVAPAPIIVCAAASVVEFADCRAAMKERAVVLWLRAELEVLVERFDHGGHRPQYGDDLRDMFQVQIETREPLYREIADLIVDVDSDPLTPAEISQSVISQLFDQSLVRSKQS